jgi:hypothetical protein
VASSRSDSYLLSASRVTGVVLAPALNVARVNSSRPCIAFLGGLVGSVGMRERQRYTNAAVMEYTCTHKQMHVLYDIIDSGPGASGRGTIEIFK